MNKQNLYTAFGICLAIIIAIGGWLITSRLMDIRSNALMYAAGVSPIAMPLQLPQTNEPETDNDNNNDDEYNPLIRLTEEERISILSNRASGGRTWAHEPSPEQITIREAFAIAEEWLNFIARQLQIHEDIFVYDNRLAWLSQNIEESALPAIYSFWTIVLSNRFMTATMLINAVEGLVWDTEITMLRPFHNEVFFYHQRQLEINQSWERSTENLLVPDIPVTLGPMLLAITIDDSISLYNHFTNKLRLNIYEEMTIVYDHNFFAMQNVFANRQAYVTFRLYQGISLISDISEIQSWPPGIDFDSAVRYQGVGRIRLYLGGRARI